MTDIREEATNARKILDHYGNAFTTTIATLLDKAGDPPDGKHWVLHVLIKEIPIEVHLIAVPDEESPKEKPAFE